MKNAIFVLIAMGSSLSMAAPSGHQSCANYIGGKKIELIYGTYALSGDMSLKIDGQRYDFAAEVEANDQGQGLIFKANDPKTGSVVQWVSTSESAPSILLTVKFADVKFENKTFPCKVLDYRDGNEQN